MTSQEKKIIHGRRFALMLFLSIVTLTSFTSAGFGIYLRAKSNQDKIAILCKAAKDNRQVLHTVLEDFKRKIIAITPDSAQRKIIISFYDPALRKTDPTKLNCKNIKNSPVKVG